MPQAVSPGTVQESLGEVDDLTFMRLPDVIAMTGLSKTSIYELIREKDFPAPVRLTPRAVAWLRFEVRRWAVDRVHASRSAIGTGYLALERARS